MTHMTVGDLTEPGERPLHDPAPGQHTAEEELSAEMATQYAPPACTWRVSSKAPPS
jgi:hypothetical protein